MKRSQTDGFSLVEVLVSIMVLAVGVIGAAGMQVTALRTAQQSGLQSTGLQLAAELADRMRANDEQMRRADGDNVFVGLDYQATEGAPDAPSADCFVRACSAHEQAEFELYGWLQRVRDSLPGARAVVCRDSTPWDDASGRLTWTCDEEGSGSLVIKIGWATREHGSQQETTEYESVPQIALLVAPYVQ